MPQELQVLQCYECCTFQVQIVKKTPKWICTLCGSKQSIKKIFAKGTGRECRVIVQELNKKRLTSSNNLSCVDPEMYKLENEESTNSLQIEKGKSKWDEFCNEVPGESSFSNNSKKCFPEMYKLIDKERRNLSQIDKSKSKWDEFCNDVSEESSFSDKSIKCNKNCKKIKDDVNLDMKVNIFENSDENILDLLSEL